MVQRSSLFTALLFGTVLALFSQSLASVAQSLPGGRPVVVELFTSQGCSSCPAADALFEQYTKRPDVIALSFSVHYWDQLGWKDTLAHAMFTDRQKSYARVRGDGQVYTPQIVIGGKNHVVGSDRSAIDSGISLSQKRDIQKSDARKRDPWVSVKLVRTAAGAVLELPASEAGSPDAIVWLAAVSRRVDVAVKRGENAGRTLTYFNAVRSFTQVGRYDGKAVELTLDAKAVEQSEADQIVVLVQQGISGPIIGAATLAVK